MMERQEGRFFPTTDAVGSTVLLTNEAGTTMARYFYEPFGTTTSANPALPNAFRFTGRELDETGLYYYRARYYHPRLHRFISEDPVGVRAGINFYSYVGNDPVRYTDPLGLDKDDSDEWPTIVPAGEVIPGPDPWLPRERPYWMPPPIPGQPADVIDINSRRPPPPPPPVVPPYVEPFPLFVPNMPAIQRYLDLLLGRYPEM